MASTYASFLRSPNASLLTPDASLHYITSTTSISEASAVLKHLASQQKSVEKQDEKVLNTVEGSGSLLLETQTTLKFLAGGGAYLPSMDASMLDERIVTLPLLHVVAFDADNKIKQIRLYWDQATMLKQVEAIGRTGRNWPIRDGKAQLELVARSVSSSGHDQSHKTPLAMRSPNEVSSGQHTRQESVGALRGQKPGLPLFTPRGLGDDDHGSTYQGPTTATRESARPEPRHYGELFAGDESKNLPVRSASPGKAGAGKHFGEVRLFDEVEDNKAVSAERQKTLATGHQPNFSFEDFASPPKVMQKLRPNDQVHWGSEVDPPSPPKRPIVHAARKDADSHFEFKDVSSPGAALERHKPQLQSGSQGQHRDAVNRSSDHDGASARPSSANTTSTDAGRRGTDFEAHYQFSGAPGANDENAAPPTASGRGARAAMDQHWAWGTPEPEQKIYKTAGDGMGGRKGGSIWGVAEADKKIYNTAGNGMGGRKGAQVWSFGGGDDDELPAVTGARGRRS